MCDLEGECSYRVQVLAATPSSAGHGVPDAGSAKASLQIPPGPATVSRRHQPAASQRSSPSATPLHGRPGGSPDGLVGQPAGVALVEAVLVGGLQLLGCGDDGAVLQAGPLRPVEVQGVARGDGSVVEYNACRPGVARRAGQERPPVPAVLTERRPSPKGPPGRLVRASS